MVVFPLIVVVANVPPDYIYIFNYMILLHTITIMWPFGPGTPNSFCTFGFPLSTSKTRSAGLPLARWAAVIPLDAEACKRCTTESIKYRGKSAGTCLGHAGAHAFSVSSRFPLNNWGSSLAVAPQRVRSCCLPSSDPGQSQTSSAWTHCSVR